jgi:hypothetical protein
MITAELYNPFHGFINSLRPVTRLLELMDETLLNGRSCDRGSKIIGARRLGSTVTLDPDLASRIGVPSAGHPSTASVKFYFTGQRSPTSSTNIKHGTIVLQ